VKYREIKEDGRIVKGVNTTVDVGTDEIKTQAAKFGNTVDKDGRPPTLSKKVKGSKTNVLHNLGLTESKQSCPRTRAHLCQCESLTQLQEGSDKTVIAQSTLEHSDTVEGLILLIQDPAGGPTLIKGTIRGLEPGEHGFHIHEYGDLSQGCESAGGHYNPDGVDHGDLENGHVGDLGNITANEDGVAEFTIKAERVDLVGERSVVGRAIGVHADVDDLGKGGDAESRKTGNAGDRLACGVIVLRNEKVEETYTRSQLPQIKNENLKKIRHTMEWAKIQDLIPVQEERIIENFKRQVDRIVAGKYNPIIVDCDNKIVNGHHRYEAARLLGYDEVAVAKLPWTIATIVENFADGKKKNENSNTVAFPGTYVKREYVTINGVKMLKDVWDYMSNDREHEHGKDDYGNAVKKDISNFTGDEDPRILKKAYRAELENFIDEFEDHDIDPQPFIDELNRLSENFADGKRKGKSRPGRVKKAGVSCKGSVTSLRKKAKKYSGEKGKMYHWCANMKGGKKK